MVVQAEATRYLTAAPERLDQTLTAVTDTGRRAISDLRHLLDLLDPEHHSEPVGDLHALVEQTRRAGQPVELTEDGGVNGLRVLHGRALTVLAAGSLACGDPDDAVRHCERALALHRGTGCRPGEARALRVLARVLTARDGTGAGDAHQRAADDLTVELGMAPTAPV